MVVNERYRRFGAGRVQGVAALAVGVLLVTPVAASGSPQASPGAGGGHGAAKPTVVLVHGAFADSSYWNGVVERLQRQGYPVVAAANPLRGLPVDTAAVTSVLDQIDGPVVLVGHSYGGAVISEAATGDPDVEALVYVAALMPEKGEVISELTGKFPGAILEPAMNRVPFRTADGGTGYDFYLDPDQYHEVFGADLPRRTTSLMAATQRPFSEDAFDDKATSAAWKTIPSWAIVATQDRALAPAVMRFEAERAGSHTVELKTSHLPMVSRPKEVADVIVDAARSEVPSGRN
ncbi:alpha/beta hydrolase [Streptomyces sp. NPDC048290]|uniref:alpha/beta fold hydrolase n=1 Tax=Streptomyces sp. NPDC048290 TaxID=3155811 RepID=UPI003442E7DB